MRITRLLFVAFLMLAVPLQGALAVSAGQCMALEHHDAPADHGAGAHDHDANAHEHDANAHDHEAAGHDDGESRGSHCGPCVACCASAAMASSYESVFLPQGPTASIEGAAPPSFTGSPPDSLERPPLSS
jgi:hypothetical protein